jgi:serine protease AprX
MYLRSMVRMAGVIAALGSILGGSPTAHGDALADKADGFLRQMTHQNATPLGPHSMRADSTFFLTHRGPHPAAVDTVNVILKLDGGLTPYRKSVLSAMSGHRYAYLPLINSVALNVPKSKLALLAALPFVVRLSQDVPIAKTDTYTVGASGAGAAQQQYGLTGQGVTVAYLDSGLRYTGSDLNDPTTGASRVLAQVSMIPDDPSTDDAAGHGTHIAGIIAGNGADSGQGTPYAGIAPGADLVSVRVLGADGSTDVSTLIAGIQWVIENKDAYHIRVMNMSLGHPVGESYTTDPLCQAVEAAWQAGIVVVCAAGNDGRLQNDSPDPTAGLDNGGYGTNYGSILSPGNDPSVITVGAMKRVDDSRSDDRIATYSSRGPSLADHILKPDLVAPGNQIVSLRAVGSTLDGEFPANVAANPEYFTLSGTSMAAPVVSGAAALLLQSDPSLTPDTVKARLMLSADKWSDGDASNVFAYGAGYLDIPAALQNTAAPTAAALSLAVVQDSSGDVAVAPVGSTGGGVVWGSSFLWGMDVAAAPADVLLGPAAASSGGVLWGTSSVWSASFLWGPDVSLAGSVIWGTDTSQVDMMTVGRGDPR